MLNKAIASGKEHRKPYIGSKAISTHCRNHGGCEWCEANRKYKYITRKMSADFKVTDYLHDTNWEDDTNSFYLFN